MLTNTFGQDESVLITGICGARGRHLTRELIRSGIRVIGVDRRPWAGGKPNNLEIHPISLRKRPFEDLFRRNKIRGVIHLGLVSNPRIDVRERYNHNVNGTRRVLKLCQQYGVEKFLLLSRGSVYGASPLNPVYMNEEAPLNASQNYAGMRDLIEIDHLTQAFSMGVSGLKGIILRPVYVVGPSVNNTMVSYLRLAVTPTVLGFDPMMQLVHQEDVVQAILLTLTHPDARGIYNICGPGALPLSVIIRESGGRRLPIPHWWIYSLMDTLWKFHVVPAPPPEIDYIRYSCILDDSRARQELGYEPQFTLEEMVRSIRPTSSKIILD